MSAAVLPAELRAAAPGFARRLGVILAALAALVARAFLHDPRRVALIIPLWRHLTRAARRFDRLMARLAAGTPARPSRPGKGSGPRPAALPSGHAWLVVALRHEAAAYACQLEHLLADPQTAELLAASPQAARILRPICRMLGLRPASLPAPPRRREPANRAPSPRPGRLPEPPSQPLAMPPPPCPRSRWPWFPRPVIKSA